ncbi:MAG: ATP-dependent DNA helicase RecG [Verrucomicrobiota bacterium]
MPQNSAPLETPVANLRGVGPERLAQLARLGLQTVRDLLLHRPRRYEDRRHFKAISELQLNEAATTRGNIVAAGLKRWANGTKSVFEIILDDGSARLHCRWWNLPFMQNYFQVGDDVLVFGKPNSLKPRTIDHPETEVIDAGEEISIHLNRIVPIYPSTEGLPQRWLRSLISRTVEEFVAKIAEPPISPTSSGTRSADREEGRTGHSVTAAVSTSADGAQVSPGFLQQLPGRAHAIELLHAPQEVADTEIARRRLALDELVDLQMAIRIRRKRLEASARGLPCSGNNKFIRQFLAKLGFQLTAAQTKVLREIRSDMGGTHPMRRLLQGDVGSGKTVVAASTALMALESGFDVALMAPTEILAEQHYRNFQKWFRPLGLTVELLTGSIKTVEGRKPIANGGKSGGPTLDARRSTLFIGTHALIEKSFCPENLGLVIIDEQHKFGVAQREKLLRKGVYPHLLVMTATPIPRTLGLTVYGDLDISVIDQMPSGRAKIKTFVRTEEKLPKVWEFVREKIAEGRQAFVIYPRVEEADEKAGLKAVTREFEKLQKDFAPYRVQLLHGRLRSKEKESAMAEFHSNRTQVLIATSVVEVGIDVPNATIMLIENADHFGLAQLHQLRGRIGRGSEESFCILIASGKSVEASQRLRVLEETSDGFRIAEEDLKLRGPGELIGQQQSGLPPFRFADFQKDRNRVERAREIVRENFKIK